MSSLFMLDILGLVTLYEKTLNHKRSQTDFLTNCYSASPVGLRLRMVGGHSTHDEHNRRG